MPICLLGAFAVLWIAGFSINLLTLLALVLAIGLVVDDAIVVLENVYHRIEEGEPPLVAAYRGTRQVGFAVISTTLVVCAVFVPICFLAGQTGLLFRELAVAMIGGDRLFRLPRAQPGADAVLQAAAARKARPVHAAGSIATSSGSSAPMPRGSTGCCGSRYCP